MRLQTLALLATTNIDGAPPGSAAFVHLPVEAMKFASADLELHGQDVVVGDGLKGRISAVTRDRAGTARAVANPGGMRGHADGR